MTLPLIRTALLAGSVLLVATASAAATESKGPSKLEDLPGGTLESVTQLLAKTRRDYGADAVVIQTQLLLNVLRNGSHLAAGVRVEGVADYAGQQYLRFQLETGLIFDDRTRDVNARVHMLWLTVLEPVLESIGNPELIYAGIAVQMQSFHRPYTSAQELRATIDSPGVSETITFYVLRTDLAALSLADITVRDLFARARITIDDSERKIATPSEDAPTLAGPL